MNTLTRFNHARPLDEQELFRLAPSIFARVAHESRSERFAPVPTIDVVRALSKEGFLPFRAEQSKARDISKRGYTKHMVRFRKVDRQDLAVGDNLLEVILQNGNDGSSAYKIDAGIFRVACLNGMVAKSKDYGSATIRHTGEALANVIDATYEVLENADKVLAAPENWSKIQLSDRSRHAFALGAHTERFGDDYTGGVEPHQLLIPRRPADMGRDLWSTFNVIQENTMQGGLTSFGGQARRRRTITRAINGVDQNVHLNKCLWVMAEYLADRSDVAV